MTACEAACAAKEECADEARDLEQRVEAMTESLRRNWSMKGVSEQTEDKVRMKVGWRNGEEIVEWKFRD